MDNMLLRIIQFHPFLSLHNFDQNGLTVLLHGTHASKATTKKCNSLAMHALATYHGEEL